MDYKLNVAYLKKEMLQHELKIRGISVDEDKTVDELRAALRPLFKLEKAGAFVHPPYSLVFSEEKTKIQKFLDEAKEAIDNLSGDQARSKFLSTQSRLVHLLERVNRIPVSDLSAEEQKERAELLVAVLATLDSLENASRQDPDLSRQFRYSDEDIPGSSGFVNVSPLHNSTRPAHTSVFQTVNPPKAQNIEKWNLKFTGDTKHLSVHNFLERVTELRQARNITERQLFDSAIDLFSGKALNWYRANKDRFCDWAGLSDLLRRHFEPPDYRARLFKEILDRTQDTSESIVDYLSCMHALFRRYGGLSEETQLDIISRNLSPFYSTQLPVVVTLDELEEECLKLEVKKYRAESYVPPSRKRQQFVEPNFAFVAVESPSSHDSNPLNVDRVDDNSRNIPSRTLICYNCRETGHFNRDCPKPRQKHCYRCGTPDVTVNTCQKCSGNVFRRNC